MGWNDEHNELTDENLKMLAGFGGRSIELDISAEDSNQKIYDIEVQRADTGADVHRAKFHSSMQDTRMLKENQKFKEIHDLYVIFTTENDVMGCGLPLYHVERTVQETDALFGDGSHIIYVNGSYKNDSDPIGKLMHDFRCTSAVGMFYNALRKPVKHFKETEGGRSQVCKAMEERINKERMEVLFESINSLMENMKLSLEQAMTALNISEQDQEVSLKDFNITLDNGSDGSIENTINFSENDKIGSKKSYLIIGKGTGSSDADLTYDLPAADKEASEMQIDNKQYTIVLKNGAGDVDKAVADGENDTADANIQISKQKSLRRTNYTDTDQNTDWGLISWKKGELTANERNLAQYAPQKQ